MLIEYPQICYTSEDVDPKKRVLFKVAYFSAILSLTDSQSKGNEWQL